MANANVPFSALPTVIGLDGSEIIPLDQAGTTKTVTVRQISAAAVASSILGNPLVITNDTNVTGTVGGVSSIALLSAATITLGFTGTLSSARLNANTVQSVSNDTNVTGVISSQNLQFGWTGTLSSARLNANTIQSVSNDTNVTGVISSQNLQLGWTGVASVPRGGSGSSTLTAHSVLLGEGTAAFGTATVGTSGATLIDQGAAADPAFKALSGDVTINSSGLTTIGSSAVTYAKLASAAQGLTFARLAKTANYSVANGDKGSLIALGGVSFFTLTLNAASGYDSNFSIAVINEDTGRGKLISPNGVTSFILWPGQTTLIYNDNNVWKYSDPGPWRAPATTFYIDPVSGSDVNNDGLATGVGAFQTIANLVTFITKNVMAGGGSIAIQLANATYSTPIAFQGGLLGSYLLSIGGAAGQAANVIISGGVSVADYIAVAFNYMTFQSVVNCSQFSIADINGTCVFASSGGVAASACGVVNLANNYTITGGTYANHMTANSNGIININATTVNVSSALSVSGFFASARFNGTIFVTNGVTYSGAGVAGSSGARYFADTGGGIQTAGGGASLFPGNQAGTATSPGWYS